MNITLQVSTRTGIVQGRERRTTAKTIYFSYEGIPFAQPPVNNLRFRDPRPAKNWKGILNATGLSQGCLEMKLRYIDVEFDGNEDCLYLNVYTPINMHLSKEGFLPVIFWIYGGAFIEGNANIYGPNTLIDKNLVVVTFNYRLGAFGFLSTEDEASPGNYGLKDQNVALRWVRKNIDKFGGDPMRITIAGQSAGACSVIHHMISPKSRGLFSRAIAWSGETTSRWGSQISPKTIALDLAINLGIKTENTTDLVDKLRRIEVENLMNAQVLVSLVHSANIFTDGLMFTPTIEPDYPEAFLKENKKIPGGGDYARVPLMMGETSMEFGLFSKFLYAVKPILTIYDMSSSSIPNGMRKMPFLESRNIGEKIKAKYFESISFSGATNTEITNFFTDILFTVPIMKTIRAMSPYLPLYFFVSAHPSKRSKEVFRAKRFPIDEEIKGAVHGEDLPLIWNMYHFGPPHDSITIHKKLSQMWKNFATTGNPTPNFDSNLGVIWPPVTDNKNISYLLMEDDMKIAYNYKKEIIDFWDELLNEYIS